MIGSLLLMLRVVRSNKHYVVLQQKTICLKPGERHQYDVDTPGFGMRFDKYLKIAQAKMPTGGQTGGIHVPLAEVQSARRPGWTSRASIWSGPPLRLVQGFELGRLVKLWRARSRLYRRRRSPE